MRRRAAFAAAFLLVAVVAREVAAEEEEDLYETLGVPRDASKKTIKKEYYRLARTWHPDKHPGDAKVEARFKKISRAYEVLSDDEQRRRYDQFGLRGLGNDGGGSGGGGGGGGFHHFGGSNGGFRMQFDEDMFRGFFGGDGGFGGGFGGGGGGFHQQQYYQEEQQTERVCHYNKICGARGCKLKMECKTF